MTGGNGFIGSHLVQALLASGFEVACLLRETSDTRFIRRELPRVRVSLGELRDPGSLAAAVHGADAVVHCAGTTRALRPGDYFATNQQGTRNLVDACGARRAHVRHLVVLSSLAATGPGTLERPAEESDRPRPVSAYGCSKLAAEREVRVRCRVPFTILRPAAVYGPRDRDFLLVFRGVRRGLAPLIDGGRQGVSLVHVEDVVQGILAVLGRPEAFGRTYHLAHPLPCRQVDLLDTLCRVMAARPARVFLPYVLLAPVYLACQVAGHLGAGASVMNLGRLPEQGAPGWVCTTDRLAADVGFVAAIPLAAGLRETYRWYVRHGWLGTS